MEILSFFGDKKLKPLCEDAQLTLLEYEEKLALNIQNGNYPDDIVPHTIQLGERISILQKNVHEAFHAACLNAQTLIQQSTSEYLANLNACQENIRTLLSRERHLCSRDDWKPLADLLTHHETCLKPLQDTSEKISQYDNTHDVREIARRLKQFRKLQEKMAGIHLDQIQKNFAFSISESQIRETRYQEEVRTNAAKMASEAPAREVLAEIREIFAEYLESLKKREPLLYPGTFRIATDLNIPRPEELAADAVTLFDKIRVVATVLQLTDDDPPLENPRGRLGQLHYYLKSDNVQHIMTTHRSGDPDPEGVTCLQRVFLLLRRALRWITTLFHPPASSEPFGRAINRMDQRLDHNPVMMSPVRA